MKKIALVLLAGLSACSKDAAISLSAIDGEILFISRRVNNSADWRMMLMNADGTGQQEISDKNVRCAYPVSSNNKTTIAFTTYENNIYHLYTIDKNSLKLTLLSTGKQYCGSPAWSPDDSKILFVKNDYNSGGNYDIYVVNSNGSGETKLTAQNDNHSPKWLPGGNSILFTSSQNSLGGIYTMQTDGSNRQLLTPANKSFGSPVISPDGSKIAFLSYDFNGSQIFTMNRDGSNIKQLTYTTSPVHIDIGYPRDANSNPVWSPDGKKIAYVSFEFENPDVFVMNANGSGQRRLTKSPMRDESPVWTKDGKHLIFSSNRQLNLSAEIYIMTASGNAQTPLTKYIADDIYPVFIEK